MAAKQRLSATTTVVQTATVSMKPQARAMLMERLDEHASISAQVATLKGTKKKPGRLYRIADEVVALFKKEKQGKALLDGTELEGHKVKLVIGKSKKFDAQGFMKKHGLTQADFDEFTDTVDNEPYVKFSHPGQEDDN